jgi:3-oxoacyl-[acyl-carrier protein] reductase
VKLKGQRILLTGASRGLGLEAARAFVREGADLLLCSRRAETLEQARRDVAAGAAPGQRVLAQPADVSRPGDVQALVRAAVDRLGGLDVLLANAGVLGPIGPLETVDLQDWVEAINVNLIGVALLCHEVLPIMKRQKSGKILILSGGGATKPMPNFSAYAASKAGVVRLAETLAEEAAPFGISVNAIAPGALNTAILNQVLTAGRDQVGPAYYDSALRQNDSGGDSIERAAALCVFLASAESDGLQGKLISAKWDPWPELPQHLADLKSDVYTLRRIVPQDRGKNWG